MRQWDNQIKTTNRQLEITSWDYGENSDRRYRFLSLSGQSWQWMRWWSNEGKSCILYMHFNLHICSTCYGLGTLQIFTHLMQNFEEDIIILYFVDERIEAREVPQSDKVIVAHTGFENRLSGPKVHVLTHSTMPHYHFTLDGDCQCISRKFIGARITPPCSVWDSRYVCVLPALTGKIETSELHSILWFLSRGTMLCYWCLLLLHDAGHWNDKRWLTGRATGLTGTAGSLSVDFQALFLLFPSVTLVLYRWYCKFTIPTINHLHRHHVSVTDNTQKEDINRSWHIWKQDKIFTVQKCNRSITQRDVLKSLAFWA